MATTYSSSKVAAGVQARANLGLNVVSARYEAATQLVINDVIQMVKIPAGAIIHDVILSVDDLDSGAACILAVGDGSVADRFIKDSNIGQAGGTARMAMVTAVDSHLFTYTAADTIDIKVTTAPAGGGVGTLNLTVLYSFEN